jgi:hypothetical protein
MIRSIKENIINNIYIRKIDKLYDCNIFCLDMNMQQSFTWKSKGIIYDKINTYICDRYMMDNSIYLLTFDSAH